MNYTNKTAIITGAASGIGKKIARTLFEKGCNAMTFSANRYLTVEDLDKTIIELIEKPRIEVWLPRSRGILDSLGSLFPGLTLSLKNKLIRKGLFNFMIPEYL